MNGMLGLYRHFLKILPLEKGSLYKRYLAYWVTGNLANWLL
ncbi:hypothetical protein MNBD_CHLOROFLEXI01-3782 [hydrothermal vent metagenome]|uniref:Uncharacterized protein n=1 Tax=hydrothermal vent metagenome TaxID=652676 RepID=A0A3B0UHL1_9ZZZZ